ncbi:MAG TPA: FadR/GntR family transcriptional regulator [Alphaproteobacteria bacterium]|nr:FadR/GntR family transcriptional regulator [Alphaproteobacteria bacterium]
MPPLPTRHQDAVDRIAAWIVRGRFDSALPLPTEAELGAELGVSRTVVREAMRTLAAKGLVLVRPGKGTHVRPPETWNLFDPQVIVWRMEAGMSRELVDDLIGFRLAIEPFAAEQAALRDDFPAADLDRAYARMVQAVNGNGSYNDADLAFHETILRGSQNQFLVHLVPFVANALRLSFDLSVRNLDSARASLPLHRKVADAITAHDGAAARAAFVDLIRSARADIYAALTERSAEVVECNRR